MDEPWTWREARREDRPLLQGFTCTVARPRPPEPHPRPWELVVQSGIRRLTPPSGPGERYRLEICTDLLRAVALLAIERATEVGTVIKLMAIAVDVASRGTGGAVADEAMEEALRTAYELAAMSGGGAQRVVAAWVHPSNGPSKRLLARFGFAPRRMATPIDEEWVLALVSQR